MRTGALYTGPGSPVRAHHRMCECVKREKHARTMRNELWRQDSTLLYLTRLHDDMLTTALSAAHAYLEDCNLAAEVAHAIDGDRAEPLRLGAEPRELEAVSGDRLFRGEDETEREGEGEGSR